MDVLLNRKIVVDYYWEVFEKLYLSDRNCRYICFIPGRSYGRNWKDAHVDFIYILEN